MKKLYSLIICCLVCLNFGLAQQSNFRISGVVADSSEVGLISSTVVLLNAADSTMSNFGLTNQEGFFRIEGLKTGKYVMQITYLGYEQFSKTFELSPSTGDLDMGVIKLALASNIMDEVVIEGEHTPMMIRKDTLIYNAAAFQTRPNEVVEDLLRKMPGIEVEDDGTVIAQGEEVRQILVDGKKFFSEDPTVATRNLPADAIDKVEVFDKMSDMAEFSGVDDGQREKTMNLELKEDRKNGYFGSIAAGYGTDDRYSGNLSLNRFNPRLQVSLISNINNINQQGFSVDQYRNFTSGLGGFGRGGRNGGIPINSGLSDGFVDTEAAGINLNYQFSEKTSINANYFLNFIGHEVRSISSRENFLDAGSYFTYDNTSQLTDNKNHRVFVELNHEIDSTQDIRIRSNLGFNDASLRSSALSSVVGFSGETENNSDQAYDNGGDNTNFSGNALYRKKFGSDANQVWTINASLNNINDEILADLRSETVFNPDDPDAKFIERILQNQIQSNDQMNYSIQSSFVQPLGNGKFLELDYQRQNFDDDLIKDVYDILNEEEYFNLELSNHYLRNYHMDRFGLSYHINTEKTAFNMEGNLQRSGLEGNMVLEDVLIEKSYFHFLPRLSLRHSVGQSSHLQINYNTNVNEPSLEQLQPIIDNTDPLNIFVGNPDLKPEYNHSLRLRYFKYDQFTFRSFFATINANYSTNSIVNERSIDENFIQTTKPRNVDRDYRISGNISYGTPMKFLKTRINLSSNFSYSNNILFINTTENHAHRYNSSLQLRIENRFKKIADVSIGGRFSYNLTNYSVNDELNQDFITQRYFTDLGFNVSDKWTFSTSLQYSIYNQETLEEKQKIPILGASISHYVLSNQRGEIKLTGFDLLDKNIGVNQSSNLNYTEYQETLSLGRYIMLSFTYALRGMNSQGGNRGSRDTRRR